MAPKKLAFKNNESFLSSGVLQLSLSLSRSSSESSLMQPSTDSLLGLGHLVLELVGSHLVLEMVLALAKGDLHVLGAWAYSIVVVFHMTHFQCVHVFRVYIPFYYLIFIAILLSV